LADSENAFAIQPRSFFVGHIGEKAEIVFLNGLRSTAVLEAALSEVDPGNWTGS
jgi:hypothetical protein